MRTVLVGGASRGLGFACAQALAGQGHRIVMCSRNLKELQEAADSIHRSTGSETTPIACDFSNRDSLIFLEQELATRHLSIDILVNNVGGPPPGRVTELSETEWQEGLDSLFWSTIRLYRMLLPAMQKNTWGRIINILSTTVVEPVPTLAISSVLRSALASYTKLVAWEVAPSGITVNSILPGAFRTQRTEVLQRHAAQHRNISLETIQTETKVSIPIRRLLEPEELGRFVAYLASDEAGGLTGALLPLDGGQTRSL